MVADAARNAAFEGALRRAIAAFRKREGRPPIVVDVGSGSGLLSMMAARAGAARVTAIESEPSN